MKGNKIRPFYVCTFTLVVALTLSFSESAGAQSNLVKRLVRKVRYPRLNGIDKVVSLGVMPCTAVSAVNVIRTLRRLVDTNVIVPHKTIVVPDRRIFHSVVASRTMNALIERNRSQSASDTFKEIVHARPEIGAYELFAANLESYFTKELRSGVAYLGELSHKSQSSVHRYRSIDYVRDRYLQKGGVYDFEDLEEIRSTFEQERSFRFMVERYRRNYEARDEMYSKHREPWDTKNLDALLSRRELSDHGLLNLVPPKEKVTIVRMCGYGSVDTHDDFFQGCNIRHEKYTVPGDKSNLDYRLYRAFSPGKGEPFISSRESMVSSASDEQLIALDIITSVMRSEWMHVMRGRVHSEVDECLEVLWTMANHYMLSQLRDIDGLDLHALIALPEQSLNSAEELNVTMKSSFGAGMSFGDCRPLAIIMLRNRLTNLIPQRILTNSEQCPPRTLSEDMENYVPGQHLRTLAYKGEELDVARARRVLADN